MHSSPTGVAWHLLVFHADPRTLDDVLNICALGFRFMNLQHRLYVKSRVNDFDLFIQVGDVNTTRSYFRKTVLRSIASNISVGVATALGHTMRSRNIYRDLSRAIVSA